MKACACPRVTDTAGDCWNASGGCFSSFETTFLWCFKHKVLLICGGNLKSGCLRLEDAADDGDTETFFTWCCRSVKVDHKERYCTSLLYLSLRMLLQHMRREEVQRSEKFKVLIIIILYRQIWRWWLWGLFPAATYTECCNILLKSPYNILQFFVLYMFPCEPQPRCCICVPEHRRNIKSSLEPPDRG